LATFTTDYSALATAMLGFKSEEEKQASDIEKLEDAIYLRNPFTNIKAPGVRRYVIFFVCGNPGLIEFYHSYLSYLYAILAKENPSDKVVVEVYGRSLGGFEINASSTPRRKWWQRPRVYSLEQQIDFVENELMETSHQLTRQSGGKRPKFILAGHSVGAYILMELIRRHRARLEQYSRDGGEDEPKRKALEPEILGGIGLFPTVTDIGQSSKGKRLKVSEAQSHILKTRTDPRKAIGKAFLWASHCIKSGRSSDLTHSL
jgi:hypothetical protein